MVPVLFTKSRRWRHWRCHRAKFSTSTGNIGFVSCERQFLRWIILPKLSPLGRFASFAKCGMRFLVARILHRKEFTFSRVAKRSAGCKLNLCGAGGTRKLLLF